MEYEDETNDEIEDDVEFEDDDVEDVEIDFWGQKLYE